MYNKERFLCIRVYFYLASAFLGKMREISQVIIISEKVTNDVSSNFCFRLTQFHGFHCDSRKLREMLIKIYKLIQSNQCNFTKRCTEMLR